MNSNGQLATPRDVQVEIESLSNQLAELDKEIPRVVQLSANKNLSDSQKNLIDTDKENPHIGQLSASNNVSQFRKNFFNSSPVITTSDLILSQNNIATESTALIKKSSENLGVQFKKSKDKLNNGKEQLNETDVDKKNEAMLAMNTTDKNLPPVATESDVQKLVT